MRNAAAANVTTQPYLAVVTCAAPPTAPIPRQGAPQTAWLLASATLLALVCAAALFCIGVPGTAIATVAAVGFAAFFSAVAGFAFSAICGAMLFHFRQDTVAVLQIMLICSIANQSLSVWALRRDIHLRALSPFLAGGVLGAPIGDWLLLHLDAGVYIRGIGATLLLYGVYMLVRPPISLRQPSVAGDVIAGLAGGLAGGFAAMPGFPVSVRCGMKGLDKIGQRAVFQPFILLMQFVTLACIATLRSRAAPVIGVPPIAWVSVPVGLICTCCGLAWFRRMTDRQFTIAINAMLIASGAALLV
jgi:uncharacterized membrane protein YfcA